MQIDRRAFTLIELLVVIAIIAVLAAILIPAIGAVRKSAQDTTSVARMRGLGEVIFLYSTDNKGRFPGNGTSATQRWFHQVAPYFGFVPDDSVDGVPLYQDAYSLNDFFTCPALHGQTIPGTSATYLARYGLNYELTAGDQTLGVPLIVVTDPAKTVMLATKANGSPGLRPQVYPAHPWGVAANLRSDRNPEGGMTADGFMGKHAYAFCDGHVEVREYFIGADAFYINNRNDEE